MKTYTFPITKLEPHQIFVFGSNMEGRHGKGAALWAKQNAGAIYGIAEGFQGNSYAIITKDLRSKEKWPRINIIDSIRWLYKYAKEDFKNYEYLIAYRNTPNLNGYTPLEMAQMFIEAGDIPENIIFEETFYKLIKEYNENI